MKQLSCSNIKTAHRWALTCAESDDPCIVLSDKRGGKQGESFYQIFPEIESSARAFAIEETSKKNYEFTVQILSQFITKKYEEVAGERLEDFQQVRSEASIRLDLARWGAKWGKNSKKPYFIGHERDDVVKSREVLVEFFI
jgi:hypothetical protein